MVEGNRDVGFDQMLYDPKNADNVLEFYAILANRRTAQ
jgi:hypothetical protein